MTDFIPVFEPDLAGNEKLYLNAPRSRGGGVNSHRRNTARA